DPPAAHGIVGYTFAADSHLLNALRWTDRAGTDLRDELVPERLAPGHTLLERATAAGIAVHVVAPLVQRGSGLSRAVLRGGDFAATHAIGDLIAETVAALGGTGPRVCYTYFGDLDLVGHLYGPGSPAWRAQLRLVDRLAQMLAEQLPGGCSLTVLADHGMVTVDPELAIEFDAEAQLREGVREVGGEARARMLYVRRGAVDDVCAAWRQRLGGHYVLCSRDELIDSGLIGPSPRSEVAARLGDLLVLPTGAGAVLCRTAEPMESNLTGHHGACSSAELLIPRLVYHSR
ncbi:MAG: alkaline phosphatase family protein, partial [Sciscionella sp.]